MKRRLFTIALAALTIGLLGSCSKINERIDGLDQRVGNIENEKIASIENQIAAINSSIADLGTIRQDILDLQVAVGAKGEDISELKAADEALGQRIDELQTYVDTELAKYATTEWANATFATLEQHQWTCDTIAKIDARIGALDAKLSQSISGLESSLKQWVNEQLDAYYTAAQMDAKLDVMRNDINNAKAQGKTATDKADSLATELTTLKTAVDTAKANIRSEYKAAVQSAIETSEGKLSQALKDSIAKVNDNITALDTRVTTLESKVLALEGKVDKLLAMVQSVTIVPAYTDGSVEAKGGILYLDIIVKPAVAVANLTTDSLKVLVNEANKVQTKAVSLDTVAIEALKADPTKGTVMARANILSKLPAPDGKALTVAVNVKNGISDFITEFYPVTLSTESNVTITDETEATKVSIETDEDFPESVMGNIGVAEGFKDTKPTSVSIPMPSLKVGGIGTVTFNETATAKIKANAEQAGATSVFFKVEDVTTTKPVENADVVLEVTMKTVDENGKEVFNKDNAGEGAEVTIEIPIPEEKDVAFVNSVTLVNDAGEPIEGGVVPGSEEIENGILTFKVNHFSKYAVDYVTTADFVSVTGVILDKTSATVEVGDTLRLVATIAPEDATNKKVTWSSDKTEVATVDATGKVTAVAFGEATITVTTKDGGKIATCKVKVTETKTMADILGTNTGIPESEDMTPPAKAWVKKTDKECKAFVGVDEGEKLFVLEKITEVDTTHFGLCMDDVFDKIDETTYKYVDEVATVTVKMTGGKFTSCECEFNLTELQVLNGTYAAPKPVEPEYVEIGGLKWATKNLGAEKVTDSGDYFAWGETAPYYEGTGCWPATPTWKSGKESGYAWESYCGSSSFSEWSTPPYDATTKILKPEFDAAAQILGNGWRMPTSADFQALNDACGGTDLPKTGGSTSTTEKGVYWCTNYDGVAGLLFCDGTNKLFFPAAGTGYGTGLKYAGVGGSYWSSSLNAGFSITNAYYFDFNEFYKESNYMPSVSRYCGLSVRPVK